MTQQTYTVIDVMKVMDIIRLYLLVNSGVVK